MTYKLNVVSTPLLSYGLVRVSNECRVNIEFTFIRSLKLKHLPKSKF
jgi:hypothetical protein